MAEHALKVASIADRFFSLANDGLRSIDRTIASWPDEFRAIVWDAVADMARQRAETARASVSSPIKEG